MTSNPSHFKLSSSFSFIFFDAMDCVHQNESHLCFHPFVSSHTLENIKEAHQITKLFFKEKCKQFLLKEEIETNPCIDKHLIRKDENVKNDITNNLFKSIHLDLHKFFYFYKNLIYGLIETHQNNNKKIKKHMNK